MATSYINIRVPESAKGDFQRACVRRSIRVTDAVRLFMFELASGNIKLNDGHIQTTPESPVYMETCSYALGKKAPVRPNKEEVEEDLTQEQKDYIEEMQRRGPPPEEEAPEPELTKEEKIRNMRMAKWTEEQIESYFKEGKTPYDK